MIKKSLPAFAAGAIFAIAAAGGGVAAFAGDSTTAARAGTTPKTGSYDATGVSLDTDNNGYTDVIAALVKCPRGTQMTGGGGGDFTSTGYLLMNSPDRYEKWMFAVGVDETVTENPANVYGSIVCYSKDGSHLGGSYRTTTSVQSEPIPAADLALLRKAVANRS
ncbi:hypothetical protein [Nocardioides ungokensis]|uniref:hypothetical protein n=1 Tax=Nocardioides ungokensis TaxID=1643322 RepID=UPI0015DEE875|nr:hypothetical protein [Nocardioides ungokensis]